MALKSNKTDNVAVVNFEEVLVNEGNAWNPAYGYVIIPYTGYYLFHLSVGAPAGTLVVTYAISGGKLAFNLYRGSNTHNGVDTMSKTVVKKFTAGDSIKVFTEETLFSNNQMQTAFLGLLLYED